MKSIRLQLVAFILILLIPALSCLGLITYWKSQEILTEMVSSSTQSLVTQSADNIKSWLDAKQAESAAIAASPLLSAKDSGQAYIIAEDRRLSAEYEVLFVADKYGDYYPSRGNPGNIKDRSYFKDVIATGKTQVSNPLINKATGNLVLIIATPIMRDGQLSGVFGSDVKFSELEQKVYNMKAGQTGHAFVVQQDGLIIAHPDKALAMSCNLLTDAAVDPMLQAVARNMTKGERGIIRSNHQGIDKWFVFAPIPGTAWSLAMAVPVAEMTGQTRTLAMLFGFVSVVILLGLVVITFVVSRRAVRPIIELNEAAARIAAGDLGKSHLPVRLQNELGQLANSFETMRGKLNQLVQNVHTSAEQLAATAEEFTAGTQESAMASQKVAHSITQVSEGAAKQNQAVHDAVEVSRYIARTVTTLSASVQQVFTLVESTTAATAGGRQYIGEAVSQMETAGQEAGQAQQVVNRLADSSRKIGEIVSVISGIAGQTNLLALNAAIEAARAGEQGRGFAVVADEVRKLAEQSEGAAKEITALINENQSEIENAVEAMSAGTRGTKLGVAVIEQAGENFARIAELVEAVAAQVRDEAAAFQTMIDENEKILTAINEIANVSQEVAAETQTVSTATEEQVATTEEIAAASQVLARMASDLQLSISKFKV